MFRYIFFLFLLGALAACSSTDTETKSSVSKKDDPGSFFTGKSESGITLGDLTRTSNKDFAGIPVNALLWRASLDIDDIDVFSGTILTDWYSLPSKENEQIKLAIFVLDKELRSDAIRVVVYVERRRGDIWEDAGIDKELSTKLEDLILTRARELRASAVTQ